MILIHINCKGNLIDKIPDCIISELGRFKYIQIRVTLKSNRNESKIVIRGKLGFSYHLRNFMEFISEMKKHKEIYDNFDFDPIGGGWINIDKTNISIYGYSTAYGKASHYLTSLILRKFYPNHKITYDERLTG